MKTTRQNLRTMLLAGFLALPLAVHAEGGAEDAPRPPEAGSRGHDGPGPGPQFGPGRDLGGPGHGGRLGEPPFLRGLDLTESQQDKVFAILHAEAPYLREQGKALDNARQALRALGNAGAYDDAKAAAQAQAMAKAVASLELQRVRTSQKLMAVLTAEQRKQLDLRIAQQPARP